MSRMSKTIDTLKTTKQEYEYHSLERVAMKCGYEKLGGGASAFVIAEHKYAPTVVKIVQSSSDTYIYYARWVKDNKLWKVNPSFPRIHEIHEEEEFKAFKLERMTPLNDEERRELSGGYKIQDYIRNNGNEPMPFFGVGHSPAFLEGVEIFKAWYHEHNRRADSIFRRLVLDLHGGNFMRRLLTEDLVFTDPVCS